jgi:peptidoglycan/xylan/chitin deacetylase (PgdA/CDA1 family)
MNVWRYAVPILCYHHITNGSSEGASEFTVSVSALDRQMALLRRLGFRSYTLGELIRAFEHGQPVRRGVVLTFDDGYRDTCTAAAPVLHAHGFKATVFAVTDYVGRTMEPDEERTFATWDELRALRAQGWEIGLHTATHADLGTADGDTLRCEVLEASRVLHRRIGEPVWSVAYPWGRYSPHAIEAVVACGARAAVTVSRSLVTPRSPRYALPRYAVRRGDTLADFLPALLTGYRPKSLIRFVRPNGRTPSRAGHNGDGVHNREEWWRA